MKIRLLSIASLAVAVAACGADRATAPDDAARAAAELDVAASHVGLAAGPAGALAVQSAASALRGGIRPTQVDITVAGVTEHWNALGHEIHVLFPGGALAGFEPPPVRALVAWRPSSTGMRVLYLLATAEDGALGPLLPVPAAGETDLAFPSVLLYSEGPNLLWQASAGEQTSKLTATGGPCSTRSVRPVAALAAPTCVEATFVFSLSGAAAEPFALRFAPGAPANAATGTRTLAMLPQTVTGVQLKVTLPAPPPPTIAGQGLP